MKSESYLNDLLNSLHSDGIPNWTTEQTFTAYKLLKELEKRRREESLNDLTELSQELGLYDEYK